MVDIRASFLQSHCGVAWRQSLCLCADRVGEMGLSFATVMVDGVWQFGIVQFRLDIFPGKSQWTILGEPAQCISQYVSSPTHGLGASSIHNDG